MLHAEGTQVIAHRGAWGNAGENSLAAFAAAADAGADAVEMDLRTTADGHVVVLHDPTLARTHGDPRAIADLTRAEVPGLPALDEVVGRHGGRIGLLLEVKPGVRVDGVLAAVAGVPGVVLQSFDRDVLRRARRLAADLPVAPLYRRAPGVRELDRAARRGDEGVGVPHALVDATLVLRARHRGLRVRAYTADAPAELDRLVALGVDGLITDAPQAARAAVARAAAAAASRVAAAA